MSPVSSIPVSHPTPPSLDPAMLPVPSALAMSTQVSPIPVANALAQPDNMVIEATQSSLPPMASPVPMPQVVSNKAFAQMFPQSEGLDPCSEAYVAELRLAWLAEAQQWGFNIRQVLNTVRLAGLGGFISKQFSKYLEINFTNLVLPSPPWTPPPCG
jgi:hypothetical protein